MQCCFWQLQWCQLVCRTNIAYIDLDSLFVHHPDKDYLSSALTYAGCLHRWPMRSNQRSDLLGIGVWRLLLTVQLLVSPLLQIQHEHRLIQNHSGSSSAFCGTGCQSGSGKCDAPPAPGNTCNAEGFANKAEYYASSFNLVDATDVSTCAALCLAEAECKSYLFNPGLGNCAYLKWSLSEGEFIATTTTNQFFWDRACAQA